MVAFDMATALGRLSEELARLSQRGLALQDATSSLAGGAGAAAAGLQDLDRMTQELGALAGFVGALSLRAGPDAGEDLAPLVAAIPLGDLAARLDGREAGPDESGELELL